MLRKHKNGFSVCKITVVLNELTLTGGCCMLASKKIVGKETEQAKVTKVVIR